MQSVGSIRLLDVQPSLAIWRIPDERLRGDRSRVAVAGADNPASAPSLIYCQRSRTAEASALSASVW